MAKVSQRKKQLPPLRNADMKNYNVSLKGKHFGVNSENKEIVLPATACRCLTVSSFVVYLHFLDQTVTEKRASVECKKTS
jgi:hypothetical protein